MSGWHRYLPQRPHRLAHVNRHDVRRQTARPTDTHTGHGMAERDRSGPAPAEAQPNAPNRRRTWTHRRVVTSQAGPLTGLTGLTG